MRFLFSLATLVALLQSSLTLVVGTYTNSGSKGIYVYDFQPKTLLATQISVAAVDNPSYLAFSPDSHYVYAVSESGSESRIHAFSFRNQTLYPVQTRSDVGTDPCYVAISPTNRLVVTANYSGGSLSAFPIGSGNEPLLGAQTFAFAGSGPDTLRQRTPHVHCTAFTPDGRYLFVTDLGSDRIYGYRVAPRPDTSAFSLELSQTLRLKAGQGPRHITFNADGTYAYLITELSGQILVLRHTEGKLKTIQTVLADKANARGSADIHLSPDGRFLYASTRLKNDALVSYQIDPKTGKLTYLETVRTKEHPRNFLLSPDGTLLLVACKNANCIQVFRRDVTTGRLTLTSKEIALPQPVCLVWGPESTSRYEVENTLPSFTGMLKKNLTFPMAWENTTQKAFPQWREEARQTLFSCMQTPPPAANPQMEITATEQRDGYKAHKIAFTISGYARVPAYLLVPDGQGPFPAVLALHDHGSKFSIGKEKMVRPFGVPAYVADEADAWVKKCYDGVFVGDLLASQGYVVLAVDALFWGERGRKEGPSYEAQQALASNLLQLGMTWPGLIIYDDIRSAELLASLPYVNPHRVHAVGFSMGAYRAWMLAAATDVITSAAAVCWMNTTSNLMTPSNNQNKGGSAYAMLLPNLPNYMDYPHVAAIACPKSMLFIAGSQDTLFPLGGVRDAFAAMRYVWESQGAGKSLITEIYDAPHCFTTAMQERVLEFLRR